MTLSSTTLAGRAVGISPDAVAASADVPLMETTVAAEIEGLTASASPLATSAPAGYLSCSLGTHV